ncbi:MAG: DUF5320 domain-containing protein [Euryarchaeota archaeon]|nr:DUF5320 domain-containing protein [Euryarchaeota archaeon]
MPGGDRTGPMGEGPMTGRGAGYCTGNELPGRTYPIPRGYVGRGRGAGVMHFGLWGRPGIGRGMGRRGGFRFSTVPVVDPYAAENVPGPVTSENERIVNLEARIQSLEQQKEDLKREVEDLRKNRATNE